MQFGASSVGYGPFFLHSQIAEASPVYDSWNDLWRVRWWDEILKIPTVTFAEDGMRKKREGEESVQEGEKYGQSMVEYDDWDGDESDSAVVMALERERR